MKKSYLLIFCIILFATATKAQTFKPNFLGEDFKLYKGTLFKFDKETTGGVMYSFYSKMEYLQSMYDNRVIYPNQKYTFNTEKDSLINRVFMVDKIINKTGMEITAPNFSEKPIFVLRDTSDQQIIYFKYDMKYEHDFPFLTSSIKFNEADLCNLIERNKDEFNGEIKLNSPLIVNGDISPMIIYKNIKSGRTTYYLSLSTSGSTVNVDGTGAIILFTDGTKLTKSVKIDVEAGKNGFDYSAFIPLTATDLLTLSMKKIKKFRLYIYDENINPIGAEKFTHFVKCIRNLK